jgi:hypothetical protein
MNVCICILIVCVVCYLFVLVFLVDVWVVLSSTFA